MQLIHQTMKYGISRDLAGYQIRRYADNGTVYLQGDDARQFEIALIGCALESEYNLLCEQYGEVMQPGYPSSPRPNYSPWGAVQHAEEVIPGVWMVSTASHGGFMISPERYKAMPMELRCNLYGGTFANGTQCFEEDCEIALVVIAFKDEFMRTKYAAFIKDAASALIGNTYAKARAYAIGQ